MPDFWHILQQTPLWVWALLALLTQQGLAACKPQTLSAVRLVALPALFFLWSLVSLWQKSEFRLLAFSAFATGVCAGLQTGWRRLNRNSFYHAASKRFKRQGSPVFLVLFLALFSLHFIRSVLLILRPTLAADPFFCGLGGLLAGLGCGLLWGGTSKLLAQKSTLRAGKKQPPDPKDG